MNNSDSSCTWLWGCLIVICIIVVLCLSSCMSAVNNSYNYINSLGISSWTDIQNRILISILGPQINKYVTETINGLSNSLKQNLRSNINEGTLLGSKIYQEIKSEIIPKIDQEVMSNYSIPANIKNFINENIISKLIDNHFVQSSGILKAFQN
ncbi:hypothetical protein Catovirus_2_9 [Catovirus CTV1]|uniref:Uncharacterized protein n=1 Tax=Catovirus CTV1 TaxID=1977631 RepID=A0A1V0SBF7_9VIRU|nr:hypothetical protein Catovirus_2_9 [Catovirus CTV1]